MSKKIRLIRTMVIEYKPVKEHYPGCETIEDMAVLDANADDRDLLFDCCVKDEVKWVIINDDNISDEEVVYTTEDGEQYTKTKIYEDIKVWLVSDNLFEVLGTQENMDKLYDYILDLATWEYPFTILDQIDEDEIEAIGLVTVNN